MTTEAIQQVLNREVSQTDREGLEKKLLDCVNLLGVSAKLKADYQRILLKRREQVMDQYAGERTALLRMIVDAQTADEQADFMLAERLNVSLAKAIDGLKSVLNITDNDEMLKW